MTEKIVVGVPVGGGSHRAVDWAAARAVARKQGLELVSVVGGAIGMVGEGEILAAAREAATEHLEAEAKRVRAPHLTVATRVVIGDPVSTLAEASHDAALLVIGSDYQRPGHGPARGSHGIRIVASAFCPVLVVPDHEISDRRGVVVGVDGSSVSEAAIAFAAEEADRLGEPLTAVTVWTPISAPRNSLMVMPDAYRAAMEEGAHEALGLSVAGLRRNHPDLQLDKRVGEGFPSAVITALAAQARLVVVGSHGRGAVRRFLLGSISHEVLQRLATVTAVVR